MEIDSYGELLLLKSIKHTLKTQSKSQWMHKEVQKYVVLFKGKTGIWYHKTEINRAEIISKTKTIGLTCLVY